ncbi:hypothetical protein X727_27065 [Mesorhizobium sp. L103C119B0]|nr:hypothetical protein X727_27065 [Mesorhizobium sp. L103C119B0]
MDHLRYSGLPFEAQREAFLAMVLADALVSDALERARTLALPDWLVVSGALYNSVWNHLTGKPPGYGIKDVDLFYFDDSDLSYEAEERSSVEPRSISRGWLCRPRCATRHGCICGIRRNSASPARAIRVPASR